MSINFLFICLLLSMCLGACSGSSEKSAPVEVNRAPVIVANTSQIVSSGEIVTFEVNVSDPDGDAVEISWQSDNENVRFLTKEGSSVDVAFPTSSVEQVIVISVTAKDSQGNTSQKAITVTLERNAQTSQSPVISMATSQQVRGGESIVIVANVQDPQGDNIVLEWDSDDIEIAFSDKSVLSPTITVPDVASTRVVLLSLSATDSDNNRSEKTLELTITPADDNEEAFVYIELLEQFDTLSGDTTVLNARLTSNVALDSIEWDLTSLMVSDAMTETITTNNITTMSATFTAPIVTELTKFPISVVAITENNIQFTSKSQVYVSAESSQNLEVSLPNNMEITEDSTISITPTIESSHSIDSYQWQWTSDQELHLLTPNNKTLSISAPRVESDMSGQLSLTVTMGQLSKTVSAELKIKNDITLSEMNYTISRLVAVKGQAINFNVITEDYEQIKEWSWDTSGVQGVKVSDSKQHFEVIAPGVSGQQTLSIIYRAKLVDNSEVLKTANVTILSEAIARTSLSLDTSAEIVVHEGVETQVNLTFTDDHGLVDAMSLDTTNTTNTFDVAEVIRTDEGIQLKLQVDNFIFDFEHTDYLFLNVNYGDYQLPFFIKVKMKVD